MSGRDAHARPGDAESLGDELDECSVRGAVEHTIGIGDSQSGNFIRTFIHLGFNQDTQNRIVWDGAFPRIAARQTPINLRFALPGTGGAQESVTFEYEARLDALEPLLGQMRSLVARLRLEV